MTREECKQLIMICEATYPNFRASNPAETLNAWEMVLGEYDYQTMLMALKMYIHTSGSAFAPSVSEMIAMTRKPQEMADQMKLLNSNWDAELLWREVRPAIRNGLYNCEAEFDKLSEPAKKLVGDPQQLREWAMMESEKIDSYIMKSFKDGVESKRIEEATRNKRQREYNAMPMEIRQMIESNVKQIGGSE